MNPACDQKSPVENNYWAAPRKDEAQKHKSPVLRNSLVEGNILIIWCFKIIGILPLTQNSLGVYLLKWKSPILAYTVILFLMTSTLAFISFTDLMHSVSKLMQKGAPPEELIIPIMGWAITLYQTVPIFFYVQMDNVIEYLEDWRIFQDHYFRDIGTPIKFRNATLQAIALTCYLILTTMFMVHFSMFSDYSELKYNVTVFNHFWQYLLYMYQAFVYHCPWVMWIALCLSVSRVAGELLKHLKESEGKSYSVEQLHLLWRELRDLTCDIGHIYSISYSVCFTLQFLVSLFNWYCVLYLIPNIDLTAKLLFTCSSIWVLIVQPEVSHYASDKLVSKFHKELARQIREAPSNDLKLALKGFQEEIVSFPPDISLAGYGKMNRAFTIATFTTFVTYLIAVMQFEGVLKG